MLVNGSGVMIKHIFSEDLGVFLHIIDIVLILKEVPAIVSVAPGVTTVTTTHRVVFVNIDRFNASSFQLGALKLAIVVCIKHLVEIHFEAMFQHDVLHKLDQDQDVFARESHLFIDHHLCQCKLDLAKTDRFAKFPEQVHDDQGNGASYFMVDIL